MDGFLCGISREKIFDIDIPHIKQLGYNSFVTENGNLYFFDKKEAKLLDTNVINVDYFDPRKSCGYYVKRIP